MMATGKMIRLMASESTVISMELGTKATGKKINNMDKVLRRGQMEQVIRATMLRAVKMVRAALHGQTRALTQGTL